MSKIDRILSYVFFGLFVFGCLECDKNSLWRTNVEDVREMYLLQNVPQDNEIIFTIICSSGNPAQEHCDRVRKIGATYPGNKRKLVVRMGVPDDNDKSGCYTNYPVINEGSKSWQEVLFCGVSEKYRNFYYVVSHQRYTECYYFYILAKNEETEINELVPFSIGCPVDQLKTNKTDKSEFEAQLENVEVIWTVDKDQIHQIYDQTYASSTKDKALAKTPICESFTKPLASFCEEAYTLLDRDLKNDLMSPGSMKPGCRTDYKVLVKSKAFPQQLLFCKIRENKYFIITSSRKNDNCFLFYSIVPSMLKKRVVPKSEVCKIYKDNVFAEERENFVACSSPIIQKTRKSFSKDAINSWEANSFEFNLTKTNSQINQKTNRSSRLQPINQESQPLKENIISFEKISHTRKKAVSNPIRNRSPLKQVFENSELNTDNQYSKNFREEKVYEIPFEYARKSVGNATHLETLGIIPKDFSKRDVTLSPLPDNSIRKKNSKKIPAPQEKSSDNLTENITSRGGRIDLKVVKDTTKARESSFGKSKSFASPQPRSPTQKKVYKNPKEPSKEKLATRSGPLDTNVIKKLERNRSMPKVRESDSRNLNEKLATRSGPLDSKVIKKLEKNPSLPKVPEDNLENLKACHTPQHDGLPHIESFNKRIVRPLRAHCRTSSETSCGESSGKVKPPWK